MTQPDSPPIVCGVMVTHQPDIQALTERLPTLLAQLDHLVITDNSLCTDVQKNLQQIIEPHGSTITLLTNNTNNLAAAQNMGIRHAQTRNADFVLLLDDDSEPPSQMVFTLLAAYHQHPKPERIGLVAPDMVDQHSQRRTKHLTARRPFGFHRRCLAPNETRDDVLTVIASGSLIPLSAFQRVGLMDERFNIDYVDKEFCLRLLSHGYRIIVTARTVLSHRIGRCKDHKLGKICLTSTNHPPSRRYTIYRNRALCWWRYGRLAPAFLWSDLCGVGYDFIRICLFEQAKWAKLSAIIRGLQDAAKQIRSE